MHVTLQYLKLLPLQHILNPLQAQLWKCHKYFDLSSYAEKKTDKGEWRKRGRWIYHGGHFDDSILRSTSVVMQNIHKLFRQKEIPGQDFAHFSKPVIHVFVWSKYMNLIIYYVVMYWFQPVVNNNMADMIQYIYIYI